MLVSSGDGMSLTMLEPLLSTSVPQHIAVRPPGLEQRSLNVATETEAAPTAADMVSEENVTPVMVVLTAGGYTVGSRVDAFLCAAECLVSRQCICQSWEVGNGQINGQKTSDDASGTGVCSDSVRNEGD